MEQADEPDGPVFDETFVRSAPTQEPSALEREHRARIDAAHRQLIEDARRNQAGHRRAVHRSNRKATRRNRLRNVTMALVLVALVGAAYWSTRSPGTRHAAVSFHGDVAADPAAAIAAAAHGTATSSASAPTTSLGEASTTSSLNIQGGQPPPGVGEQAVPIGHPAPPPVTTGPFKFLETQPGDTDPVAYDPCRPIHVVINDRTAPPGGDALVRAALARASAISGIQFVYDGTTTEAPSRDRAVYQPDRYPGVWAPVLVAWTDPQELTDLAGDVAGFGGSSPVQLGDALVYVSGEIYLDGPQLAQLLGSSGGPADVQALIEHEAGHLLGLAHVSDPTQIMNPVGTEGVVDYAAGDQLGLEELGRGHCFPQV